MTYNKFEEMIKESNNIWIKKVDLKYIKIEGTTISFQIQDGPIKEYGKNGCQIDDLGIIWLSILKSFNKKYPSRFNSLAITDIEDALNRQANRKEERRLRNVEGYDKL